MVLSCRAIERNIVLKVMEVVDAICGLTNTLELSNIWVRGSLGYLSLNEPLLWFSWIIDTHVCRMLPNLDVFYPSGPSGPANHFIASRTRMMK
jgi:hypothetical protein